MRWLLLCLAIGCSHTHDAPPAAPDAQPDAFTVACGDDSCVPGTNVYCYMQTAGVLPVVTPPTPGCNAIPPSCLATQTCACVAATVSCGGVAPTCDDSSGIVTITCAFP